MTNHRFRVAPEPWMRCYTGGGTEGQALVFKVLSSVIPATPHGARDAEKRLTAAVFACLTT